MQYGKVIAASMLIDWIKAETRGKFIRDFNKLTDIISDKDVIKHLDDTDKKTYKEAIETVKKFKLNNKSFEVLEAKF